MTNTIRIGIGEQVALLQRAGRNPRGVIVETFSRENRLLRVVDDVGDRVRSTIAYNTQCGPLWLFLERPE
jgi:hypothetical protein